MFSLVDWEAGFYEEVPENSLYNLIVNFPDRNKTRQLINKWSRLDGWAKQRYGIMPLLRKAWPDDSGILETLKTDALREDHFEDGCGCDNRDHAWKSLEDEAAENDDIFEWVLSQALNNEDLQLKLKAVNSLKKRENDRRTLAALETVYDSGPNPEICSSALTFIADGRMDDPGIFNKVLNAAYEGEDDVRGSAIYLPGESNAKEAEDCLYFIVWEDPDQYNRSAALRSLSKHLVIYNMQSFWSNANPSILLNTSGAKPLND